MLRKHAGLAETMGIPSSNIYIGDIGDVVEINEAFLRNAGTVPAGRVLVDGGTVNPLPLNRVRREEGDLLVAVDVSARFGADSVRRANASLNYYKVLIASSQIMQQRITQLMCRLYKPDIMVGLPADSYGMFEFYRSEEILEAGRAATRAALERLETDGKNGMVFAESEEKIATARF